MKTTNYSQIADKYDKNQYRHKVGEDDVLKEYMDKHKHLQYKVLDLACGTGIYLLNQKQYFRNSNVNWHGLDASEDMLKIAREKVSNISFIKGVAENLPYEPNYFDFSI